MGEIVADELSSAKTPTGNNADKTRLVIRFFFTLRPLS
tara:strand:- start:27877 stop:27990 length:114 start_codon:yes stop_codon:yes gene_type:complete